MTNINQIVQSFNENKNLIIGVSLLLFGWEELGFFFGTNIRPAYGIYLAYNGTRNLFSSARNYFIRD